MLRQHTIQHHSTLDFNISDQPYLVALEQALGNQNLQGQSPQVILKTLETLPTFMFHARHPITQNTLLLDALDPCFYHDDLTLKASIIEKLLEKGSDANAINAKDQSAVYLACHEDDWGTFQKVIKLLLQYQADILQKNNKDKNILELLYYDPENIFSLSEDKFIFLLDQINQPDVQAFPYINVWSVLANHANNVLRAVVNQQVLSEDLVLHSLKYCIEYDQPELALLLLEKYSDSLYHQIIHSLLIYSFSRNFFDFFRKLFCHPHYRPTSYNLFPLLIDCLEQNQLEVLELILNKYASALDNDRTDSLLIHALQRQNYVFFLKILQNVCYTTTPHVLFLIVLTAFETESVSSIKIVLDFFQDKVRNIFEINEAFFSEWKTRDGRSDLLSGLHIKNRYNTLLQKLIKNDQAQILWMMLNHGLHVDCTLEFAVSNFSKVTANLLAVAIFQKSYQIIQLFKAQGSNLKPIESSGLLKIALLLMEQNIFNLLLEHGAADNETVVCNNIGTLAHYVIDYSNQNKVYWPIHALINYGLWETHPNIEFYQKTPLALANSNTKRYIIQLINRLDCGKTMYGFKTRSDVLHYFALSKNLRCFFKHQDTMSICRKGSKERVALPNELKLIILKVVTDISDIEPLFKTEQDVDPFTFKTLNFREVVKSCEDHGMCLTPWGLK